MLEQRKGSMIPWYLYRNDPRVAEKTSLPVMEKPKVAQPDTTMIILTFRTGSCRHGS